MRKAVGAMALFALGDLHLSHAVAVAKPMDIFGPVWEKHEDKIARNWRRIVRPEDLVLIPGDISWALKLDGALPDLNWLARLPGEKLLVRGNHDYWWTGIGKIRRVLPPGIYALQNDYFPWREWAICGTRGWICPGQEGFDPVHDEKLYRRELGRLRLSLEKAVKDGFAQMVVALHYPPTNGRHEPSGFTDLFHNYPVKKCIYGHLHGEAQTAALVGEWEGIEYSLVAADAVDFTPVLILA
jgi:predicted phosphohydrolase